MFDVGGVLYHWHPRYLYEKLIPDRDRLEWFCANVVTPEWHFQHDAGRPAAETTAELVAAFPEERDLIEAYVPRWLETLPGPVDGMIELVHALADQGVPLYGITNFSHEFWPRFASTEPAFARFHDIIVSGEERLVKPDPAIFALAKRRFPVDPARALFIDDRDDNIAAAEAAGYRGHVFTSADRARAALTALGLSL
ncbi:HAD family phosphatase [uncultured Sphingosinicella sp.]|uniref:HAD family hydrolase n=1 Tax=uncultured Sphingosinicella sp. TaxID=478748 RepID=UPI0030DC056F